MYDPDPPFRPVRRVDGYLPLEDLGLIGDGTTSALVGLDGSIPWMCLPRFDSEPLFCGLLDHGRGGHFTVAPDDLVEARQWYAPDTGVLTTDLRTPDGVVRLTDALTLRPGADLTDDTPAGRAELVRSAQVLSGRVRLRADLEPRGGAQARALFSGVEVRPYRQPGLRLHLRCNLPLEGLRNSYDMQQVTASTWFCPGGASTVTTASTPTPCSPRPVRRGIAGWLGSPTRALRSPWSGGPRSP
jgi:hypothetical protein